MESQRNVLRSRKIKKIIRALLDCLISPTQLYDWTHVQEQKKETMEAKEYMRREPKIRRRVTVWHGRQMDRELKNEGRTILSVFERIAGRTPRDFDR